MNTFYKKKTFEIEISLDVKASDPGLFWLGLIQNISLIESHLATELV